MATGSHLWEYRVSMYLIFFCLYTFFLCSITISKYGPTNSKLFIHSRPNKTVTASWFGPWPSYQQPLASVMFDPLANSWTRPFVRGSGEVGGLCSAQIPAAWLWGKSSTSQSTAVPIQLFRPQQGEQLPGITGNSWASSAWAMGLWLWV